MCYTKGMKKLVLFVVVISIILSSVLAKSSVVLVGGWQITGHDNWEGLGGSGLKKDLYRYPIAIPSYINEKTEKKDDVGYTSSLTISPLMIGKRLERSSEKLKLSIAGDVTFRSVSATGHAVYNFIPLISLDLSMKLATGWNLSYGDDDIYGLAEYDLNKGKYSKFDSFSQLGYDFGAMLKFTLPYPLPIPRFIASTSFLLHYVGLTGVDDGTFFIGPVEGPVTGLKYVWETSFVYIPQHDFIKMISLSSKVEGYTDDKYFDDEYSAYDGDFAKITITPAIMVEKGRHRFMLSSPIVSPRVFTTSWDDIDEIPLLTRESGRSFHWSGLQFMYSLGF